MLTSQFNRYRACLSSFRAARNITRRVPANPPRQHAARASSSRLLSHRLPVLSLCAAIWDTPSVLHHTLCLLPFLLL